jgi:hypothetical protein
LSYSEADGEKGISGLADLRRRLGLDADGDGSELEGELRRSLEGLLAAASGRTIGQIVGSIPPRPRHVGPEAWLGEMERIDARGKETWRDQ